MEKVRRYSVNFLEEKFNVFVEKIDKYEDRFSVSDTTHVWKALSTSQAGYVFCTGRTLAELHDRLSAQEAEDNL
jgi:hypothetical protein